MAFRFVLLLIGCATICCDTRDDTELTRPYRMGFQNSAPTVGDIDPFLQSLTLWTQRADAAIISTEVPWEELLAGEHPADYITAHFLDLAMFYQSKNLLLWVYVDPQNGLDRSSDALELSDVARSIAEPEIQEIYRRFVLVMDSLLKPAHIGLALETNLIRDAATPAIYQGVKQAANQAASELQNRNTNAKLSISVQVDHAWGKLVGGAFQGIAQDFVDFPFVEELGLSSYPYFGFDKPKEIPLDYYSELVSGKTLPVFVAEGGWTSASLITPGGTIVSNEQIQEDYIHYHDEILRQANATAVFQLVFTDIDVDNLPPDVPDNLYYFSSLGLVDIQFNPKPALAAWDEYFAIRPNY